jgi:hypothetical protein
MSLSNLGVMVSLTLAGGLRARAYFDGAAIPPRTGAAQFYSRLPDLH